MIEAYERTELIITEFDTEDVITTSGTIITPPTVTTFSLDEYEGRAIIDD